MFSVKSFANLNIVSCTDAPSEFNLFSPYVKQPAVRAAMHTGQAVFGDNAGKCEINLVADFHVSLAPELITLLEHPELYASTKKKS
jgi:hypothetical protein